MKWVPDDRQFTLFNVFLDQIFLQVRISIFQVLYSFHLLPPLFPSYDYVSIYVSIAIDRVCFTVDFSF